MNGLGTAPAIAFVPSLDLDRSRGFYERLLGLEITGSDGFALWARAGGVAVRIAKVPELRPAPFTVIGFFVEDISTHVRALAGRGILFERFPNADADGVWTAPNGDKVAWLKDPDGNVIGLTELAK